MNLHIEQNQPESWFLFYVAKLLIYKDRAWIPRKLIGYLCLCVSQHFKLLLTCFSSVVSMINMHLY